MATKQEEIKEGIKYELRKRKFTGEFLSDAEYADGIVRRLHSQGVVIKVDRGHDSDCAVHNEPAYPNGPCTCITLPKGCVAVEPLRVKE